MPTLKYLQAFRDKVYETFEVKTETDWIFDGEDSVAISVPDTAATFIQIDNLLKEIDEWIEATFPKKA